MIGLLRRNYQEAKGFDVSVEPASTGVLVSPNGSSGTW